MLIEGELAWQGAAGAALHYASHRAQPRLSAKTAPAMPEQLLESVLFGHARRIYRRLSDHVGLFQQADGGTIFLMKSAKPRRRFRPSCCACCRKAKSARGQPAPAEGGRMRVVSATNRTLADRC